MQNRNTLKGYFVTNAVPTQGNFSELIESAFIQIEDGIRKQGKEPLSLLAQEDNNGEQQLLHFYKNFTDATPAWKFSLLNQGDNTASGLSIGNTATAPNALFISENKGNVGIGTATPYTALDVKGNIYSTIHGNNSEHDASNRGITRIGMKAGNDANDGFAGLELETELFPKNVSRTPGNAGGNDSNAGNGGIIKFMTWGCNVSVSREVMRIDENGNVGIGTATPGFPLTFKNALGEKISFWGQSGNSYGIGIQGAQLQLYTDTRDASIVFGYGSSSSFNETMRITGTGNVGIGTGATTPGARLHVRGGDLLVEGAIKPSNGNTSANGIYFSGDPAGGGGDTAWIRYRAQNYVGTTPTQDDHTVLEIGTSNDTDDHIVLMPSGNVGIGTPNPVNKLDVNGAIHTNGHSIYFREGTSDKYDFIKWNKDSDQLNIAGFYGVRLGHSSVTGGDTMTSVLTVNNKGFVGIGTETPQATLHVYGGPNYNYNGQIGYLHNDGSVGKWNAAGLDNVSILASGRIVGWEMNVYSDQRIKKNIILNDSQQSLNTLNQIQIKDFLYKDALQHGNASHKGVIAQELEPVFPEAVTAHVDFVPDIYSLPQSAAVSNNILTITMQKPHNLTTGDTILLIMAAGRREVKVVVSGSNTFSVSNWQEESTEIFVYGKQVSDYRTVNYNSIFCLGISAIQELYKQLQQLSKEVGSIKEKLSQSFALAL